MMGLKKTSSELIANPSLVSSPYVSKWIGYNQRAECEISVYKNDTDNYIDCVYEITYPDPKRASGVLGTSDCLGVSFDNIGTGFTSCSLCSVYGWTQSQNGGKGYITAGATYAYVIENTTPRDHNATSII